RSQNHCRASVLRNPQTHGWPAGRRRVGTLGWRRTTVWVRSQAGWSGARRRGLENWRRRRARKGGQKLSMVLATFRIPWTELAEILQSQYRAVGIDLQVQKMERGPYLDFTRAYQHNLCASAGTNIDPDELRLRYHSENRPVTNFANLGDDQLDG